MKVTLLMSMTVDGKIAKSSNEFINWTGKKDKQFFINQTKDSGVVIMGSKTYDTLKKPLSERLNIILTTDKDRRENDLVHNGGIIFTTRSVDQILSFLEPVGYKVVCIIGGSITNSLFANYLTDVYLTIVPKFFGQGLSLFNTDLDINLKLNSVDKLDENCILLKYQIEK